MLVMLVGRKCLQRPSSRHMFKLRRLRIAGSANKASKTAKKYALAEPVHALAETRSLRTADSNRAALSSLLFQLL